MQSRRYRIAMIIPIVLSSMGAGHHHHRDETPPPGKPRCIPHTHERAGCPQCLSGCAAPTINPSGKGYYCLRSDGSVFAYGDAKYSGGVNNAGPGGTSALPAGDSCTSLSICASGGYWVATAQDNLYAFGGAPFLGKP